MNNQDIIDYVMDTPHNTNPTILKQKLNEQDFENRSDWNQNDSTKPDYVKNRTHYTEVREEILFDGDVVFHHNAQPQTWYPLGKTPIIEGDIYKVNWNGAVFECQATLLENYVGFGNPYVFKPTVYADQDNGMPFYVLYAGGALTCGVLTPEIKFSASFSLSRCEEVVHKIPEKYLPDGILGLKKYDKFLSSPLDVGRALDEYLGDIGIVWQDNETHSVNLPAGNWNEFRGFCFYIYDNGYPAVFYGTKVFVNTWGDSEGRDCVDLSFENVGWVEEGTFYQPYDELKLAYEFETETLNVTTEYVMDTVPKQ